MIERHNVVVRKNLVLKLVSGHFYYYMTQPLIIHVSFTHLNYGISSLQQSKIIEHHKEEMDKEKQSSVAKRIEFCIIHVPP